MSEIDILILGLVAAALMFCVPFVVYKRWKDRR